MLILMQFGLYLTWGISLCAMSDYHLYFVVYLNYQSVLKTKQKGGKNMQGCFVTEQ